MVSGLSTSAVIPTTNFLGTTTLWEPKKAGFLLMLGMVLLDIKPEFHSENVFLWFCKYLV